MFKFKQYAWFLFLVIVIASLQMTACTPKPQTTTRQPTNSTATSTTVTSSASTSLTPTTLVTASLETTPPGVNSVNPANNANGVDISTTLTVLFSEKMNPSSINKNSFKLMKGSTPVSGTVNYDENSQSAVLNTDFNLEYGTAYTATITSAVKDVAGNQLPSDYRWSFTTIKSDGTSAEDTNPPTVISTVPGNNASGTATTSTIKVVFSESINASSLNSTTFNLKKGTTPISGTVSYDDASKTATLTPAASLTAGSTYAATVTNGVKDLAGNSLPTTYSWNFTTAGVGDNSPPTVSSTSPASGATGVAINSPIKAVFSEAINKATVSTASFTLTRSGSAVSGSVNYDEGTKTATFTSSTNLANATGYTATITTAVKDLAGNGLAVNYSWNFTTVSSGGGSSTTTTPDTTPPTILTVYPLPAEGAAPVSATITVTFSEAMAQGTITGANFTLKKGATAVSGAVSYDSINKTAIFTPSPALTNNTQYVAQISGAVTDTTGNPLGTAFSWAFTTTAASDTTPPTVSLVNPAENSSGIAINTGITATFSEAMTPTSLSSSSFNLKSGGTNIAGTASYNSSNRTATFTPGASLLNGTTYTATITTDVTDVAGNHLAQNRVWTFTTASVAQGVPISLSGPNTAAAGSTFSFDLNVGQVTGLNAFQFTLTYNPGVIEVDDNGLLLTGVTLGPLAGQKMNLTWGFFPPDTQGKITVTGRIPLSSAPNTVSGQGSLVTVHFKVVGSAGQNTQLTLSNTKIFNVLGEEITSNFTPSVTVTIQ